MNIIKKIKNFNNIIYTEINKGLNNNNIKFISEFNNENFNLLNFRLNSFKKLKFIKFPDWIYFEFPDINYDFINLFSNLNFNDNEIKNKIFDNIINNLGISNKFENSVIDIILNSKNINSTNIYINKLKLELFKQGILYFSFLNINNKYKFLLNKYIGKVISSGDNFFSAINSSIFSEGAFSYIPKNIKCLIKLGTYFKIVNDKSGQFERTLIITSKNSSIKYGEGCSAPNYYESQLHTAIVELIAKDKSIINYSTMQNWAKGNNLGYGGVFNLTTKRGICFYKSIINWIQVEMGSSITWKYPCTILLGDKSKSEFYSLSMISSTQIADTGGKIIHIGNNTVSRIISKSISLNYSQNIYRGLIEIFPSSNFCISNAQCGSLLIKNKALTVTLPYIKVYNNKSKIQQEAYISNIQQDQIFFMLQRNYTLKKALNILINNFCNSITTLLPNEYMIEFPLLLKSRIEEISD